MKADLINVDLPQGKVYAQIWQINVGRNSLYLLDTNIDEMKFLNIKILQTNCMVAIEIHAFNKRFCWE